MAISLGDLKSARATQPPRVLIYGPPGMGKEQPLTAKILTPFGWRTMGDMKVGMPVCGADGRTHQVTGVFYQGVKPAYRIVFKDGTSTEAGEDHLWKVAGHHVSRDGWLVRTTKQLMEGNSRKRVARGYRIPVTEPIEFANVAELPVAPYILGAMIGDGALTQNTMALSVPPAKEPIRAKVESLLGGEYALHITHPEASAPQWTICGGKRAESTMRVIFDRLGLCVSSKERFIPDIYKLSSIADRLELLRGLMDTDGSCKEGRTTFHTCSDMLSNDMCDLVRSLGGVAIPRLYEYNDKSQWMVNVRMTECPFSIECYKAAEWRPAKFSFGKHFTSIEYIGDVEQQCISVSAPGHLYITDDYIVTHNTTLASEFPSPVFIQSEDGTPGDVEITSFGQLTTYDDVMDAITALYTEEHQFKTVVVDSLDKLEPIVWEKCCSDNGWKSIEDPGYGKGYTMVDTYWREFFMGLNGLRRSKGMASVSIAHATIGTFPNPSGAEYPRWDIRLHKRALGIVQDEVDAILLLNNEASVKTDTAGSKTRAHAAGGTTRWVYCDGRPAWVAKNRYGMAEKFPYQKGQGFQTLEQYFPKF